MLVRGPRPRGRGDGPGSRSQRASLSLGRLPPRVQRLLASGRRRARARIADEIEEGSAAPALGPVPRLGAMGVSLAGEAAAMLARQLATISR
ncbi:MAG: hypothetical protein U0841_29345 [Chloroflexia bacterium]